ARFDVKDDLRLVAGLRAEAVLEQVVGALGVGPREGEVGGVGRTDGPGDADGRDQRGDPRGEDQAAVAEAPGGEGAHRGTLAALLERFLRAGEGGSAESRRLSLPARVRRIHL